MDTWDMNTLFKLTLTVAILDKFESCQFWQFYVSCKNGEKAGLLKQKMALKHTFPNRAVI